MKRIIARFEYILNTYLREFVKLSIDEWVQFIKSFTVPNLDKGELWKIQTTPMIVVHLNFKMKEREDKNKRHRKNKDEKKKAEDDE